MATTGKKAGKSTSVKVESKPRKPRKTGPTRDKPRENPITLTTEEVNREAAKVNGDPLGLFSKARESSELALKEARHITELSHIADRAQPEAEKVYSVIEKLQSERRSLRKGTPDYKRVDSLLRRQFALLREAEENEAGYITIMRVRSERVAKATSVSQVVDVAYNASETGVFVRSVKFKANPLCLKQGKKGSQREVKLYPREGMEGDKPTGKPDPRAAQLLRDIIAKRIEIWKSNSRRVQGSAAEANEES